MLEPGEGGDGAHRRGRDVEAFRRVPETLEEDLRYGELAPEQKWDSLLFAKAVRARSLLRKRVAQEVQEIPQGQARDPAGLPVDDRELGSVDVHVPAADVVVLEHRRDRREAARKPAR